MQTTNCPRCHSSHTVKNGHALGKPRRKCRSCGLQYTRTTKRGKPQHILNTALILYLSGLSMNHIARLLSVSTPAVLYWIRTAAQKLAHKPEPSEDTVVVELDEMWHYLGKKLKSYGYGKPTSEPVAVLLIGNVAVVTGRRSKNCSIGSSTGK